ncbi:MAG: tRNA (guanine10-N2)-dimethyltransferase [Actinomycetota bacterium]
MANAKSEASSGSETPLLVRLGWNTEFAVASLSTLSKRIELLRPDLAVAFGDRRRLAQMGLVHEVVEFLGVADVGDLAFDPAVVWSPYAVRIHDERRFSAEARSNLLAALWTRVPAARVDLDLPRTVLHAYWTPQGVAWGRDLRTPAFRPSDHQARPYVRSYMVPSRKARWLNDLAGVVDGSDVLDPFCGTGSLLLEASRLGAVVSGSDSDRGAVLGTTTNMRSEGFSGDLRVADARAPYSEWRRTFDAIVTDLPYGRSASIRATDITSLATEWLDASGGVVRPRARIVVMAPAGVLPDSAGELRVVHRFTERVHRSLSREIVVYRPLSASLRRWA